MKNKETDFEGRVVGDRKAKLDLDDWSPNFSVALILKFLSPALLTASVDFSLKVFQRNTSLFKYVYAPKSIVVKINKVSLRSRLLLRL